MSYDPKCYELAEYFLDDDPKPATANANELAQLIQDTIEDYLHIPEPECECEQVDVDLVDSRYCPAHGPNSDMAKRQRAQEAEDEAKFWQNMPEPGSRDRDEWQHEAAEQQRLK